MRSVLRLVVSNPIATVLMVIFMALAGMYSAWHMPVDLFPNLDIPVVNIITHYPGASEEDMERLVSRPIEDEILTIPGVKRVASTSVQGISQVTAEFTWGTTILDATQLAQARLARLAGLLPAGASLRLENIGATLQEVCGYVIYGGGDMVTLRNIVRHDLAGRLMGVEGVSSVEVLGGDQRAFYVEIKPEVLIRLHLSVDNLVSVLKDHNISAVAGYLGQSGREYLIRGDARLKTLDDIRSLPVRNDGARPVLLGDIAKVFEGRAPRHYAVQGDAVPAVAMIVRKQPGASTIRVARGVENALTRLTDLLPRETRVKKFYDQSEIIKESQDVIMHDLVVGALLVVIVLYFFLGSVRPTLIVALTIPITFLATVAIMMWLGMGLNVITMTALTLAIGMIVDDAIVVAENIDRHAHLASEADEASIEGALEIAGPDASGTFTTVAAFLPFVLMTGIAALFIRPFGLTISAALIVSLLLSLTLVPTLFSRMKGLSSSRNDFPGARLLKRLDAALQATLRFSFRHKWFVLSLAALALGAAGLSAFLGKTSVLPPIDEGAILIEYVMPPGTSLNESDRIGDTLDRIALADSDVSCVYRRTGSPGNGYQIEGVNKGELLLKLKAKGERTRSTGQIIRALKESYSKLSGVVFLYHQPTQEKIDESLSGLPALFGITIYGADMDTLISLADRVETMLSKESGVSNVVNNTKVKVPQIDVRINYPSLAQYGVDAASVLSALKAARFGVEATRIIRQKEDVAVLVRMDADTPSDINSIKQLPIGTTRGDWLPLERIAEVSINHAPSAISRLNGQREITLLVEVEGNIPSMVKDLRRQFQSLELPEGYSIDFTGQYQALIETAIEMGFAVAASVVLIYLVMAMQFGSWLQPLIILMTVPLSLVGALAGLFLARQGIDISVGMGTVTLVGIAVNNAIVLMDFANRELASGKSVTDALLSAASVRLRPILLTTLTTIAALLPAAIGTTVGSKIFQPFAITVISGLVSGVLATLVIVPTLIAKAEVHDSKKITSTTLGT
ncbi:MAG: efflux RND transporter permease subunit [Nitrospinae bacterium]|nr:efflux RND transporter permease subunit [Nitrospinota bacterium]